MIKDNKNLLVHELPYGPFYNLFDNEDKGLLGLVVFSSLMQGPLLLSIMELVQLLVTLVRIMSKSVT